MKRCWVVGPVAWDKVLHVDALPEGEHLSSADRGSERPGGSGFNVSCGLATVPLNVSLVSYCGGDEHGDKIVRVLQRWGVDLSFLQRLDFPTPQATIFVTDSGEKSGVVTSSDLLGLVPVPSAAAQAGDLVYFSVWESKFSAAASEYMRNGVTVAISASCVSDGLDAHYVIGAASALPLPAGANPFELLKPSMPSLKAVFSTGERSAFAGSKTEALELPDANAETVDITGAIDAFAAGALVGVFHGVDLNQALEFAQRWRTAASLLPASMPPPWTSLGLEID